MTRQVRKAERRVHRTGVANLAREKCAIPQKSRILFVFIRSRVELDNGGVPDQCARPKFSATPGSFVRVRTTNDAVCRKAINVHLLAAGKRKVAEMYAYARSAGALDNQHNYLRAIPIDEFLCSRLRRDCDTSVDPDLVRRPDRNRSNIQPVQSYTGLVQIYVRSVSHTG